MKDHPIDQVEPGMAPSSSAATQPASRTAEAPSAPADKLNVSWHMKDMAGEVQRHAGDAFGEVGGHAKNMAGETLRHAQDAFGDVGHHAQGLADEVAHHSQQAAGEVRREVPVLIEHVRETIVDLFHTAGRN